MARNQDNSQATLVCEGFGLGFTRRHHLVFAVARRIQIGMKGRGGGALEEE